MPTSDNRDAFEVIFRSTYDSVYAYVLRRADPAEAEDIVAETYAVAWRRFDIMPTEPIPWLYAVARRILANARRAGRRRADLATRLAMHLSPATSSESDPAEQSEDAAVMRAALGALRGGDREVLLLVGWEGLDNEAAAQALGISSDAFAVQLHRARRRLQAEIDRRTPPSGAKPSTATP